MIGLQTARRRLIMFAAMLFGLVLWLQGSPAGAQQWTQEQRAACEPDAMRLCSQYVPDVERITACMSLNRRHLSPQCRAMFGGVKKRRQRG